MKIIFRFDILVMGIANDKPTISITAKCFANSNIKILAKILAKNLYITSSSKILQVLKISAYCEDGKNFRSK